MHAYIEKKKNFNKLEVRLAVINVDLCESGTTKAKTSILLPNQKVAFLIAGAIPAEASSNIISSSLSVSVIGRLSLPFPSSQVETL